MAELTIWCCRPHSLNPVAIKYRPCTSHHSESAQFPRLTHRCLALVRAQAPCSVSSSYASKRGSCTRRSACACASAPEQARHQCASFGDFETRYHRESLDPEQNVHAAAPLATRLRGDAMPRTQCTIRLCTAWPRYRHVGMNLGSMKYMIFQEI
jgi:hypothetical protein